MICMNLQNAFYNINHDILLKKYPLLDFQFNQLYGFNLTFLIEDFAK